MRLDDFTTELIAAGHATTEPAQLAEPMTLSGDYTATNGFSYSCHWNNGLAHVAKIGYSAEYRNAVRDLEARGIVQDKEGYSAWERAMRAKLNLKGG